MTRHYWLTMRGQKKAPKPINKVPGLSLSIIYNHQNVDFYLTPIFTVLPSFVRMMLMPR